MRWAGRERFVVLDSLSGSVERFLLAWQAWRDDPHRCANLHYLAAIDGADDGNCRPVEAPAHHVVSEELRSDLLAAWPPLTTGMHRLSFEAGNVELLLIVGPTARLFVRCAATVDHFVAGEAQLPTFKALARLAAPRATLDLACGAGDEPSGLLSAGFQLQPSSGRSFGQLPRRIAAVYAPSFTPKRPPAREPPAPGAARHVVIVGAGLAGCAAAWSLAEQGWSSTLIERGPALATETSGNPGGLFHGIVNAADGLHARFNRAAALEAARAARVAIGQHGVDGRVNGLLRLETDGADAHSMCRLLERIGLPPTYARAVNAQEASALSGLTLNHPAWWYPEGGWIDPAALARSFVERAGTRTTPRFGTAVSRLVRENDEWRLDDAEGQCIARSAVVVLANAGDAIGLIGTADGAPDRLGVDLASVRGQISLVDASLPGVHAPRVPVAGAGYVLPANRGSIVTGASATENDADPGLRVQDHLRNIDRFSALTGSGSLPGDASMHGRVGWRCVAPDRLPLIGAVPRRATADVTVRLEQPRMVPREPGLFVYTALGSRGITWSALGARILASWITGAPFPVEADLIDAVDAARFVSRAARC